ncbi:MAG: hypothetical protein GYA35_05295, partial [Thermoanaerobaculaceae bacterium]|nr:hypothetical protein [Thermoanaerobaculaceae bacterium]
MIKSKIMVWLLLLVFVLNPFLSLLDFKEIKAANDPSLAGARDTSTSISPSISGQVSLSSGAFTTSIPIEIPPGRNGLQPAIALSYNSSGQIGVGGVGWDIPASSIMRLGGRKGTPKYDATDEFYLNLNGTTTKLIPYGDGTYRTRIETWSKITPYPNNSSPIYWIVKSKSGETYTFGSSLYPGGYAYLANLNGQTIMNSWMLSKVEDIDGNFINYNYTNPTGNNCFNALLPSEIRYGAGAGLNHFADIVFSYSEINPQDDYMDIKISYFLALGVPVKQNKRLEHIYVKDISGKVLRDYELGYTKSNFTGRSLLATLQVTYYKPDGSSPYSPPLYTFEYSAWAQGTQYDPSVTSPIEWEDYPDSIPGLPFVSDEYKSGDSRDYPYQYGSVLMDINGDGLIDKIDRIETRNPFNSVSKIYLQQRDSNGAIIWREASNPSIPGQPFTYIDFSNALENLDTGVRFGDVNGDGLPDKIDYWLCPSDGPFPNPTATMNIYLADPKLPGWRSTPISFSQIDYDYNLGVKGLPFSAFWKDAGGKWHTLQKGTFLVDVNGDGYVDKVDSERLADQNGGTTAYQTRLGTGSGFSEPVNEWKPPTDSDYFVQLVDYSKSGSRQQYPVDRGYRFSDLNGDGLPDIIKYCNDSGTISLKVYMNKGLGWVLYPHPNPDTGLFGKVFSEVKMNSDNVAQSNDRGAMLFDINGDGLPDKVDRFITCYTAPPNDPFDPDPSCASTYNFNDIHFNVGGFASEESGNNVYSNLFFSLYDTYFPWYSTGIEKPLPDRTVFSQKFYFNPSNQVNLQEATRDLGVRVADINMDGIPDFIKSYRRVNCTPSCSQSGWSNHLILSKMTDGSNQRYAGSEKRDILVYMKNPLGGTTAINYDSADNFYYKTPSDSPISSPIVPWVVKSVTVNDGGNDYITTSYLYFGPTFDPVEKQFVGFKRVIVTKPDGQSEETLFYTDFPLSGMTKSVNYYESVVNPLSGAQPYLSTSTEYDNLTPVNNIYHPHKKYDIKTEKEGGRQITTRVAYSSYDSYDNPLEIITEGNTAISGDEKKVVTEYLNDETDWLFGFAISSTIYAKNDTGVWEPTSKKRFYYDGNNNTWPQTTSTISKGKVTCEENWLKSDIPATDTWIKTVFTTYNYDGTIKTVTQKGAGRGNADLITTFSYDSTHRFPVSIIKDYNDGQGWSVSKTYDIWGNILTETDIKGNSTSTSYDALGRPTLKSIKPSGYSSYITTTSYDYTNAFDLRYITVNTRGPGAISSSCGSSSSLISSVTYYDRLGRITKVESKGWNGQTVVTETQYEYGTGRIRQTSRPHFVGNAASWLTKSYDSRGRISQETGFGKTKVYSYGITSSGYYSSGVNVSGHTKTTYTDVYGRIRQVSSDVSDTLYYFYDVMGSLIKVSKNSDGNNPFVELTYDSWGRKTSYYDSDSDVKTEYYYDIGGRLTQQKEISVSTGSSLATTFTYNGYQGQLDVKQYSSGLKTTYAYYGSNQGLNSGEVQLIQDTFQGIQATKIASRTYNRAIQSDGTILMQTVYIVPWKENTGSNTLSLTFSTFTDLRGNIVKTQFPNVTGAPDETVQISYQSLSGLLEKVSDANCNSYAQYTDYTAENLRSMTRGAMLYTTYWHDSTTNHLTKVQTSYGGYVKQDLNYTYTLDDLVSYVSDSGPSNYDQSFTYDNKMRLTCFSSPSGYKNYDYSSDGYDDLLHSDDRELNYGNSKHRVMSDGAGWIYLYDGFGRLGAARKNGGEETKGYIYDNWGRLIKFNEKGRQDSTSKIKGVYEYFGDGTRFKKVVFDETQNPYEHLTINGYEIEQLKNGMIRYRYPIAGPTGVIAYKERITTATAFANAVNRQSEYTLASIHFDKFLNHITSPPNGNPIIAAGSVITTGKELLSTLNHGFKGLQLDPKNQEKAILLLMFIIAGCFIIVLFGGYPRRKLEKLLIKFIPFRRRMKDTTSEPLRGLLFFNP